MADRIADIWGSRTPRAPGSPWPARVDQYLEAGVGEAEVTWSKSACVLCSNGCGMDIAVRDGRIVGVRGRVGDHVNRRLERSKSVLSTRGPLALAFSFYDSGQLFLEDYLFGAVRLEEVGRLGPEANRDHRR